MIRYVGEYIWLGIDKMGLDQLQDNVNVRFNAKSCYYLNNSLEMLILIVR